MGSSARSNHIDWYLPEKRGIIPLDSFHVSSNVRRMVRNGHFELRINSCFEEVMRQCANRPETWINDIIIESYKELNRLGFAHSFEIFQDGELSGGLYGGAIGKAFFGESMFRITPEADKAALFYCHRELVRNEFILWDTQYYTPHLASFGCVEISNQKYQRLLKKALQN